MRTFLALAIATTMALGWPCAFPDGKGNPYTPTKLPPGEPQVHWSMSEVKSPTPACIVENRLYFASQNIANCLDLETGKKIWGAELVSNIVTPPCFVSGRAIFCDKVGNVYSIDSSNGKVIDKASTSSGIVAPPIVISGLIYVSSTSGKVVSFTPDLKEQMSVDLETPLSCSPIITSQGLFQQTSDGTIYIVNPENGAILSNIKADPPIGQMCQNDGLINIPVQSGITRLKGDQRIPIELPSSPSCMVAVPGGPLVVGTSFGLYGISGDKLSWSMKTEKPVSAVSANSEIAVFGCAGGLVAGVRLKDGEVLWKATMAGDIAHPIPIIHDGLVVSSSKSVTFFKLWDLNPEPSIIDLGHVPTGEIATGSFSMSNPANSTGPVQVICTSEKQEITINPGNAIIVPGGKAFFNVVLDSTGIKEGKYSTTITIKTKTSSYKVVVGYNIVPQPFVAELKLGDPIMKMKRGTQKWEVKLDSPPFLQSNRTMVPLRAISESFGPKVTYVKDGCPGSGRVDITLGGTIIYHCIGTNMLTLKLPGKQPEAKTFDTASVIVAGRTFVPIRFIAEAFLATVNWDANTKTVIITYQPP